MSYDAYTYTLLVVLSSSPANTRTHGTCAHVHTEVHTYTFCLQWKLAAFHHWRWSCLLAHTHTLTHVFFLFSVETHSLASLKMILSTGSPLKPSSYEYVYRDIKKDLVLGSISGLRRRQTWTFFNLMFPVRAHSMFCWKITGARDLMGHFEFPVNFMWDCPTVSPKQDPLYMSLQLNLVCWYATTNNQSKCKQSGHNVNTCW